MAVLAGGTLPQANRLSTEEMLAWQKQWPHLAGWFDALGLSAIHASPFFLALCLLLLVSIFFGMWLHWQRMRACLSGEAPSTHRMAGRGPLPADLALIFPAGTTQRVYGRVGVWGGLLFHGGVALIIVAGAVSGSNRFAAHVELAEGEVFDGRRDKLAVEQGEVPDMEQMGFRLRLDKLAVAVQGGNLRELRAHLSYQQKGGELQQAVLETNHPLKIGAYTLSLDKHMGRAAMFERIQPDGSRRWLLINFPVPRAEWGKGKPLQRSHVLTLENSTVSYRMSLLPGASPVFDVTAEWRGKTTFSGRLTPGMAAAVGPYQLVFHGEVPWVGLYLASDRAEMAVFAGFVLALAGFLLYLLFLPKHLALRRDGEQWLVEAWARPDDWTFERNWHAWQSSVAARQAVGA